MQARLVRRGIGLSAALAAVEASRSAASAAGITPLLASTVRCAVAFAARPSAEAGGASAGAAALAGQTLRSMAVARLTIAAALRLAPARLAAGSLMHPAASAPSPGLAQGRLASCV